jgi:magnesium-transporting ATPase (P-type)
VLDALLFSLAIAVGITPQLLPAVVSTSLAAGPPNAAAVADATVFARVSP